MSKIKRILLIAVAVIAVVALSSGLFYALGDDNIPTVVFNAADGVADDARFSFENVVYGVEESPTATADDPYPDLFQIRGAMPGDSFSWNVKVKVTGATNKKVTMWVRAENATRDFNALFDATNTYPPTLTVTGFPDGVARTGYLDGETPVELGEFNGNETKDLQLALAIDLLAGNEIAGLDAEIDWVFYAKVDDVTPQPTPTPTPTPGGGGGGGGDEPEDPLYPPAPELNTEDHFGYIIGIPGGEVRPEDNISRAETATILFRLLTDESRAQYWSTTNSFSDVQSTDWFNNAISTLANAGILNGRLDGTFGPRDPITRAEYATMFVRFFDAVASDRDMFPDIADHWARENINTAALYGFINGRPDGTFGPNEYITRAEAMTLTNRVLGRKPDKDHLHPDMIIWSDNTPDKWYYAQVQEATNSHEFQMMGEEGEEQYEEWTAILPMRDWSALEKQWAEANAEGSNVYSSKPNN